ILPLVPQGQGVNAAALGRSLSAAGPARGVGPGLLTLSSEDPMLSSFLSVLATSGSGRPPIGLHLLHRLTTQAIVSCLGFLSILFSGQVLADNDTRRPNVVLIVADDLGYADVGVYGCKDVPTPHIDSLAKHGVRCTSGYVSGPYCSPTRAGLMTGRYQQ